jgi:hypothetical protein
MDSLSEEEFQALDEETQERYCHADEFDEPIFEDEEDSVKNRRGLRSSESRYVRVNSRGEPMPHSRYLRDSRGREQDDPYYENSRRKFKEDRKETEKAFAEEQKHWLMEQLPFRISIVSASQCLPVFGTDQKLEGLVIKRSFNRETLLAHDYVWEEESDLLVPTPEDEDTGEVTLYEYWGQDASGSPYVSYSVNGNKTHFREYDEELEDGEEGEEGYCDAIIDLRKEFGLRKLPIMYSWGLHWETDDVRMKGVPFLWPVLGAITGVEALSTSILVHSYSTAFGSWGVQADPQILRDFPDILTENGRPRSFVFAPLTTTIFLSHLEAL